MSRVHDAMERARLRPVSAPPEAAQSPATPALVPSPLPHDEELPLVVTPPAVASSAIDAAINVDTVIDPNIDPIVVDEFRKLASAVHQAQSAQDLKILTVASGTAEEGKSMTALNLALTLATSYHREVLLIDADLRAPSLAGRLEAPAAPGLTDLLNAPPGSSWPLHRVSPTLSLLTAGHRTRDPISRISSAKMKQFMIEAREKFDTIIIDTPPVGPFPDAALLSAMADATILVVRAGTASYKVAQRAIDVLGEERILGVVLNRVAWAAFNESYGYYGRYRQKG